MDHVAAMFEIMFNVSDKVLGILHGGRRKDENIVLFVGYLNIVVLLIA